MRDFCFVINKEEGPSSFDIVREVKRVFPDEKVGHAGSLDPFATGVLIILVGRATKLSDLVIQSDKVYRGVVKLGEATDTLDRTGTVVESRPIPLLTEEDVQKVFRSFEGEWLQTPPNYSAKKIHGVRLYKLARNQIHVRLTPSPVQIYEMRLIKYESPLIYFEVECSKGTYIRSLAAEMGLRLGTVAHLKDLSRLSCGNFRLDDSLRLSELIQNPEGWVEKGYRNFLKLRSAHLFRQGTSHNSSFTNAGAQC